MHHLQTSLDVSCVPWDKVARLHAIAVKQLNSGHHPKYVSLGLKTQVANFWMKGQGKTYLFDEVEKHIHAMQMALNFWNKHSVEMKVVG